MKSNKETNAKSTQQQARDAMICPNDIYIYICTIYLACSFVKEIIKDRGMICEHLENKRLYVWGSMWPAGRACLLAIRLAAAVPNQPTI